MTCAAAERVARELVEPLGRRWWHVTAVVGRAQELREAVDQDERDTLVAAAWLHDIGYSPHLVTTRFHPLDGARYLRDHGWPEQVVCLVAHHSGARYEAEERGLAEQLAEFRFDDSPLMDALVAADLTTGPRGERMTYDTRIDEILGRYGPGDPVHDTWTKARSVVGAAVQRALARAGETQPR